MWFFSGSLELKLWMRVLTKCTQVARAVLRKQKPGVSVTAAYTLNTQGQGLIPSNKKGRGKEGWGWGQEFAFLHMEVIYSLDWGHSAATCKLSTSPVLSAISAATGLSNLKFPGSNYAIITSPVTEVFPINYCQKIKQIFVISHEARENVRVINKHVDCLPKQQNKLYRFKYIYKISLN